jgi:preprotein translocase subunit SecA
MVTNAIRSAQSQVEAQNFEIRKNVLKYDEVLNRQRTVIYGERHQVLEGADLHEQIRNMIDDTVAAYVVAATSDGYPEEWDLDQLWTALGTLYPVGLTIPELLEASGGDKSGLSSEHMVEELKTDAQAAYDRREEELGEEATREFERRVLLSVLDRKWREHLYEMDYLQEGIGLRQMAQRDPLVEYQREGFDLFAAMMDAIKEESVGYLFHLEVQVEDEATQQAAAAEAAAQQAALQPGQQAGQQSGQTSGQSSAQGSNGAPASRSAESVVAALAAGGAPAAPSAPVLKAKGLDGRRQTQLEYSAPSIDGAGGVEHRTQGANGADPVEIDPNASRAERRRQARAQRKGN